MSFDAVLSDAASQRTALKALEGTARTQVQAAYGSFSTKFAVLLTRVVKNNPMSSADDVLKREDITEALQAVFDQAQQSSRQAIKAAFVSASALGQQAIQSDLSKLGVSAGTPEPLDMAYLNHVLEDLDRNIVAAAEQVVQATIAAWDQPLPASYHEGGTSTNPLRDQSKNRAAAVAKALDKIRADAQLRTELGASVVAQRSFSDAQEASLKSALAVNPGAHLRKIWLAQFKGNNPCPSCAELHGTIVEVGEEFPHGSFNLPVYRDLMGPPRHPNCRCRQAPFLDGLSPKPVTSVEQAQAAKPPVQMTSAQVRQMSGSRYSALVAALRAAFKALSRRKK